MIRNAPDLTPVISAAVPVAGDVLLVDRQRPAFTRTVRDQRGFILAAMAVLILHVGPPFARSSPGPSSARCGGWRSPRTGSGLAGRARSTSPACPTRIDEIGMLARAVSDMSQSLRQRIDNIEAFAADVSTSSRTRSPPFARRSMGSTASTTRSFGQN